MSIVHRLPWYLTPMNDPTKIDGGKMAPSDFGVHSLKTQPLGLKGTYLVLPLLFGSLGCSLESFGLHQ